MQIPPDGFGTHGVFANDPFGIAFYSGGDRARRTPVGAVASADKTRVRGFDFDKGPGAEAAVYDEGFDGGDFHGRRTFKKIKIWLSDRSLLCAPGTIDAASERMLHARRQLWVGCRLMIS